jgi:hypothetical protein
VGNKLGGTGTTGTANGSFTGQVYTIDRIAPTVTGTAVKGPNFGATDTYTANSWTNQSVRVTFTCTDTGGSLITAGSVPQTLPDYTAETSGTTANFSGTAAPASFGLIKIDKSAPTNIQFSGGGLTNGGSYPFGSVPAGPTGCSANGDISGLKSACSTDAATTYKTTVGTHTITATAEDNAGNIGQATLVYTVGAWNATGFYSPVGTTNSKFLAAPATLPTVNNTPEWNTVKGGLTIPLKFNVYESVGGPEKTSTDDIQFLKAQQLPCSATTGGTLPDPVDFTTTETTSLRYSGTPGVDGQFIQNWKTPKVSGETCYRTAVTFDDGSSIYGFFKLLAR